MAREKDVLGYIDCPACGHAGGMRITHDKNGEPFGFCEANCDQQLRIGGNRRRVAAFVARFPWSAGKPAAPVPVPVPEKKAPAGKPEPEKKPGFSYGL